MPAPVAQTNHRRELESIQEAAARNGVTARTVRRWIADGRLTAFRAGPKLIRLDVAEVDAMLSPIPTASAGPA